MTACSISIASIRSNLLEMLEIKFKSCLQVNKLKILDCKINKSKYSYETWQTLFSFEMSM